MTKRYANGRDNPSGSPWRNGGPEDRRHTTRPNLRMRPELVEALDRAAEQLGVTRSEAAERAVEALCQDLEIEIARQLLKNRHVTKK